MYTRHALVKRKYKASSSYGFTYFHELTKEMSLKCALHTYIIKASSVAFHRPPVFYDFILSLNPIIKTSLPI